MDRKATTRDASAPTTALPKAGAGSKASDHAENSDCLCSFIQQIQTAVVVHGPDTAIRAVNVRALDLLGLREDEALGRTAEDPAWHLLRDDGTRMPVEEYPVVRALATRQPVMDVTGGICRPDRGDVVWCMVNAVPVFESDGRLSRVVVTLVDFTARRRTQEALRLDESRLEALLKLGEMTDAPLKAITDFAMEEGVRLTRSKIGYLAFMDDDGRVLTMHSWSRSAMAECQIQEKPLHYPVDTTGLWGEAVRQRKPIITNDYAAPNPFKKGCPEGHVTMTRHMNIPVLDGDKIVAVAGVGNKDEPYDETDVRQLQLLMDGMWRLVQRKRAQEEIRTLNEELERRVADRTANLEAVNKELEAFSYSVSHDLRAPLRRIDAFTQALAEDCCETLDGPGKEYVAWIRKEVRHMARLIEDLLNLARITRSDVRRTRVDLSALAREIIDHCRTNEPDRRIDFIVAENLWVNADENLMRILLENLLGNAWKFTRMRDPARIELGATAQNGKTVYFIRDNGAGFDMAYAGKLFGAFQRLHSEKEFEGTGVGLAIVQRILARHGGKIWAQAAVGQGATFYFTL